jgi:uncharacterized protein YjbJ (UPF0337 family)
VEYFPQKSHAVEFCPKSLPCLVALLRAFLYWKSAVPTPVAFYFLYVWLIHQTIRKMDNQRLKGNWNQIKGKLKQKYGELTDDDLTYVEGKEDELYGRIQKKVGKSKDEVRAEIERENANV